MKKIEINYYLLNGIGGIYNTIHINAKPDMTISDVFDKVRQKHKSEKDIIEIRLLDVKRLKAELS